MKLTTKVLVTSSLALGLLGVGAGAAQAENYVPGPVQDTVTSVPAPPDAGKPQSGNLPQTGSDGRLLLGWASLGVATLIGGSALVYGARRA